MKYPTSKQKLWEAPRTGMTIGTAPPPSLRTGIRVEQNHSPPAASRCYETLRWRSVCCSSKAENYKN